MAGCSESSFRHARPCFEQWPVFTCCCAIDAPVRTLQQHRGDAQYTSVPCLTQKLANCGQPGALPAVSAHDEIAPFLPHLQEHRESSV